jgi:hypothetical protein
MTDDHAWKKFPYILYAFTNLDSNTTCLSLLLCCYTNLNVA